jgi:hypothetical protein
MTASPEDRQEDRPATLGAIVLSVALTTVALGALSGAVSIVAVVLFFTPPHFVWGSRGSWMTLGFLALNLLIAGLALWGLLRLKPWKDWGGPMSPATRKTNKLYWLKEGLAGVAMLVVIFGALNPKAAFSNSPVPLWVAVVAIPCWLVARVIREGWRNSSDEHARRASDFGRNAALGVFLAVTPAWWIAWRAGIAPQPDAMILWLLAMLVSTAGWSWRLNN